ncbi:MAG: hypothetical protein GY913_31065 [Proteobacteria bacterium]|nr:hypothetical protein [Pseudomonadota bacterium]MCP4921359.1 hypothetical protein [Pseudomonadota bacterium]
MTWIALTALAMAGPVEEDVARARAAILAEDWEQAKASLDKAEASAPTVDAVILGDTLAGIWFYRGALEYHTGDRDEAMLQHWRAALVLDINYRYDRDAVVNPVSADLFEALRSEVNQRPQYSAGSHEDAIDARIFVDGVLQHDYDHIRLGRHLAQVSCPDGQVHADWVEVEGDVDLYSLCPTGVEFLTATLVAEPEPEDTKKPKKEREPLDLDVPSLALMAGGGALLAGGTAANFVWVEPAFARVDAANTDPTTVSRLQADAITRDFNVARATTLGLLGGGVLAVTAGVLVNDSIGVLAGPSGVVVAGTF